MWNRLRRRKRKCDVKTDRAYVEINISNLEHNVEVLKNEMHEGCELMAVVKANAYTELMKFQLILRRLGYRHLPSLQ